MNPDTPFFSDLLAVSWRAGWLIVVIVALRRLVRGRISAQVWFAAWLVVALRLLLPFSVPATWSPFNLAGWWEVREVPAPATAFEPVIIVDAPPPLPPEAVAAVTPWTPMEKLSAIWLAGVVAMIALRLAAWRAFRRRLRTAQPLADARVRALLAREGAAAARLVTLETDAVDAPALYGLVRPRLLFPRGLAERLSEAELRHVVRHELGHWRRRDLLAQGLMQAAVVLHWFNPLAWLGARLARADCELACDEFVLRREAADDGAGAYGATLLKVLGMVRRGRRPSSVVAMLEGREQLAHRIRMIAGYRAAGAGRVLAGVLLIAGLAIASVTRESRADDAAAVPPAATVVSPPTPASTPNGAETDKAGAFARDLQAVVAEQRKRVQSLEQELAAHKERNGLTSLDQRKDLVNAGLKAANQEVLRLSQALRASEIRVNQINDSRVRKGALTDLPFIASQPIVSRLLQEQVTQKMALARLGERYGVEHPEMIKTTREVAGTEQALARAIDMSCAQIEAEYNGARLSLEQARAELEWRTKESLELDRAALGLNDKAREVQNQENILRTLQQRQLDVVRDGGSIDGSVRGRAPGDYSISVVGAVKNQGAVNFGSDDSPIVLDVIARSGGFTEEADRSRVQLIRANAGGTRTTIVLTEAALMAGTGPEAKLQRGDVVVVPALPATTGARRVSVLGQVTNPGSYPVPPDSKLTLVELIAQAGGTSRLANLRQVRLTRPGRNGQKKVYTINVDALIKGDEAEEWTIEPGDIVYVPERIL